MKPKHSSAVVAVLAALMIDDVAGTPLPLQFDENTYPANPENTFGAFTYGDFAASGAVTDGSTSLILDIQDTNGNDGVFGGVGVDFGPFVNGALVPHDFDPALAEWVVRVKLLPNNRATALRTSYVDVDDLLGTAGDEHVFEFDLTVVPLDGNFHDLIKPASMHLFTHAVPGLGAGNFVNDPGLRQIQIQSVLGSMERLNVEVDFAAIRAVPEPATIVLVALGGVIAMGFRPQKRV